MFSNAMSKSCYPKSEEMYFPSHWTDEAAMNQYSPKKDYDPMRFRTSPPSDQCSCSMCLSYKSYYNTLQFSCKEQPGCPCYSTTSPPNYQYFSALSSQFPYERSSLFPTESPTSIDDHQFDSATNRSNSFVTPPDYIIKEMNSSKSNSYIHIDTEVLPSVSPKRAITASQIDQSPSFSTSSSSAALSLSQSSTDGIQFLKSIDPIECNATHRQDATNKPPYSYITLIVSAMRSKPSRKITLNEIYAWIMNSFAYYRRNVRRWQNSIRHALSFNDCFIKVPRPSGEAGKGNYWTVHPNAIDMFENGSTMRRNRKFIDSSKDGVSTKRRRTASSTKSPKTMLLHPASNSPSLEMKEKASNVSENYVAHGGYFLSAANSDYRFAAATGMNFCSPVRSNKGESLYHSDYSSPYRVWSDPQYRFPISGDVC